VQAEQELVVPRAVMEIIVHLKQLQVPVVAVEQVIHRVVMCQPAVEARVAVLHMIISMGREEQVILRQ